MKSASPTLKVLEVLFDTDACLHGKGDGIEPFSLLDMEAKSNDQADWRTLVPHDIGEELLLHGWIYGKARSDNSKKQEFRISEEGRDLISRLRKNTD